MQAGAPATEERGWYLYGVTRSGVLPTRRPERGNGDRGMAELALDTGTDEGEPMQVLDCGALAAIARCVLLADFSEEALRARHDDNAWFAEMAHRHNQVIAAIHQQQAVLAAKFGSVYAHAEDVQRAVAEAQETLLAQLECAEGCDEWAVHTYADHPTIAQRLAAEHPTLRQLQQELASAHPSRSYFLQRKLDEERAAAVEHVLRELPQAAYEHLARWAAASWLEATRGRSPRGGASRVTQPTRSTPNAQGEIEVLRAAFLERRAQADTFLTELRSYAQGRDGVHCQYSGPWAPYSFAVPIKEDTP
jgi:hypothetical protein